MRRRVHHPRFDDSVINIRDWQTALQVVICGREALRGARLIAENDFLLRSYLIGSPLFNAMRRLVRQ